MGLVKFGQQTFNVDGIPDGHVIVAESDVTRYKQIADSYALLKRNIPVDVEEGQIAGLIERGRRYDGLETSLNEATGKVKNLEGELKKRNLPENFDANKWNNWVQREKDEIFQTKIDALTKKVAEKVEKEFNIKLSVDPRFIDPTKLEAFNPDDEKAFDNWYAIMDEAHTAQEEFVKSKLSAESPQAGIQQGKETIVPGFENPLRHAGDKITDTGIVVGGLNR